MSLRRRLLEVSSGDDVVAAEVVSGGAPGRPAALLVHGSGGNRATWWRLVPLLAAERTVVTVDVRGSGRSTDAAALLGPEQVAADLEAVRRAAGVDRWHVVGHSLGAWHALRWAAEHPELTASAVALSSVAGVLTPGVVEFLAGFTALAAAWTPGDGLGRSASFSEGWSAHHADEVYLHQLLRDLNPPPRRGVPGERMAEAALTAEQRAALGSLAVLFLTGSEDPFAPPAAVRAAADGVPGARCEVLAGAGHMLWWESLAPTAARLGTWFGSAD